MIPHDHGWRAAKAELRRARVCIWSGRERSALEAMLQFCWLADSAWRRP